jgi:hypothetical protein
MDFERHGVGQQILAHAAKIVTSPVSASYGLLFG